MSTRCHIQVKSQGKIYPCIIYKHSDGYPEGTLPFLEAFTKRFFDQRGDDPEYFVAQYLRQLAITEQEDAIQSEFYKDMPEYHPKNSFLGYGVCPLKNKHADIEYVYTADLSTGNVSTKDVHND